MFDVTDGMDRSASVFFDFAFETLERWEELESVIDALKQLGKRVAAFDGGELAAQAGSAKVLSMVMLGAAYASGLVPVSEETLLSVVAEKVPQKTVETNLAAFALGKRAYEEANA